MNDTPMHRTLFVEMNAQEQEDFINGLQQRRLVTVEKYKEALQLKQRAQDAKINAELDKVCIKLEKDLARYNNLHDTVMASIGRLTALTTLAKAGV